jgi:hypothetical protein
VVLVVDSDPEGPAAEGREERRRLRPLERDRLERAARGGGAVRPCKAVLLGLGIIWALVLVLEVYTLLTPSLSQYGHGYVALPMAAVLLLVCLCSRLNPPARPARPAQPLAAAAA